MSQDVSTLTSYLTPGNVASVAARLNRADLASETRGMAMAKIDERRQLPRFPLEISVRVGLPGSDAAVMGRTRDVSAVGIFFYVSYPLQESSDIQFIMTLPPELTRTIAINISCKARIVRVREDAMRGQMGVAAAIDSYDFLVS